MSLSKLKKVFTINKKIFPELISTNEKFLFDLRNKLTHSDKGLNEVEAKKLFTSRKYFYNDLFLTGIKSHVLGFNSFKNHILMKIFGFDNMKSGYSIINILVNYFFFLLLFFTKFIDLSWNHFRISLFILRKRNQ